MAIAAGSPVITPVHPCLGARVEGVDLARPLDDAAFARIAAAFEEHSVLVFHDQPLTDAQQQAFTERWGPLEATVRTLGREDRLGERIVDLSNTDEDGRLMPWSDRRMIYQSGNQLWHSDSSFKPVPAHLSALSARVVPPEGGETEFCSTRVVWDELPPARRRALEGKVAVHSFAWSRGLVDPTILDEETRRRYPPVRQALVRTNPVNGRQAVFIGSHAWYIEGLPFEEGRALLDELTAMATRPERIYQHRWRQHDLVLWDNRCVLHRGRPWDSARHARVMHRTTVAGDGPTA